MMVVLIACLGFAAKAQFVHTSWKGNIKGDVAQACTLTFGKDTVVLYGKDGGVIETMRYAANPKALVLTLTKIAGQSDCSAGSAGKYKITIMGNKLTLVVAADDCSDRSIALDKTIWAKQKSK